MDSFDRNFSIFRVFFVLVFLFIIVGFLFKAKIVVGAMNGRKTLYEIDVNNFNQQETYMTKEYTRDKETGCIKFKDEFGITHVICNNYSITEY